MFESIAMLLEKLRENESAIARLYRQFARSFPEDAEFWDAVVRDEEQHSEWLAQMRAIATSGKIRAGSGNLRVEAINSAIDYLAAVSENCDQGRLDRENAFAIAFDIENSLLEKRFFTVFTSDSAEFKHLADTIMRETVRHRNAIGDALRSIRSAGRR
ncbi:MAG TPA: hypothetical protein PLI53_00470 [Geobacteraceae bacterium]|nr:hypothetical protein [Geobacteraceae bacterium]